ncbi:NADPH-dependent FMN reductase [Streptomyces sp. 4N509B]|uniref:NADPH-dependent FMN reductase n=1 Tax=Streptomyces sp. 4N509B TaxID=3457413 RepID=UPI003FD4739B
MSDNAPLKLAVILASVREGRFGPVVARWYTDRLAGDARFEVDVIDLARESLPLALPAESPKMAGDAYRRPPEMAELTRRLEAADAFVVITPEYNRSFPAALKSAIDWHFTQWQAKPVGFVGYSGMSGALLAIEQLKQVFGELYAHPVRNGVIFPRYYLLFDGEGNLKEPEEANEAAGLMLEELAWWGTALRTARGVRPLAGV